MINHYVLDFFFSCSEVPSNFVCLVNEYSTFRAATSSPNQYFQVIWYISIPLLESLLHS